MLFFDRDKVLGFLRGLVAEQLAGFLFLGEFGGLAVGC